MTPLDLYLAVERIIGREPTKEELPDIADTIARGLADSTNRNAEECVK